jgi:hypothetical protein
MLVGKVLPWGCSAVFDSPGLGLVLVGVKSGICPPLTPRMSDHTPQQGRFSKGDVVEVRNGPCAVGRKVGACGAVFRSCWARAVT